MYIIPSEKMYEKSTKVENRCADQKKFKMAGNSVARDIGDIVTRTLEDIYNLESQIRNLLRTMDVVDDIKSAPIIQLPEPFTRKSVDGEETRPGYRMMWHGASNEGQKRGKTIPNPDMRVNIEEDGVDIDEMLIDESMAKYIPLSDTAFFVPILDSKLKKPKVAVNVIHPATSTDKLTQERQVSRGFHYDTHVSIKEVSLERLNLAKTTEGLVHHGLFSSDSNLPEQVMPGCEVLVTATFACPANLLSSGFSLLFSVYLEGEELWAREVPITDNCFSAASIDEVLKKHHLSIMTAIGKESESFELKRIILHKEMSLLKSLERFLLPLGYENIGSVSIGADSIIELYTTHQPSLLWGTCIKIERRSTKPTVIRCLVSSRSNEQMAHFFAHLESWLEKYRKKEKSQRLAGITISPVNPKNNSSAYEKLQAEIGLLVKLHHIMSSGKKENQGRRVEKWRLMDSHNDMNMVYSSFLHEYSICVAKTDSVFVNKNPAI